MRKQLLALLSALGLAGSATPGTAQVLKGADSPAKAETQQKQNNTDKGVLIGLSQPSDAKQKRKKNDKAVLVGLSQADAQKKQRKVGGESLAGGEGIRDKRTKLQLENDAARKPQTIKLTNAQMGDGSVIKASKTAGEANSVKTETLVKGKKTAANTSAVQSEAKKKVDQASPK